MKFINVCDYDASRPEDIRLQTYGKYVGHYHSVRHIEVSDDFKYMLSSSEDHSIYLWLNETMQPDHILAGHTDLCVSNELSRLLLIRIYSIEWCNFSQ